MRRSDDLPIHRLCRPCRVKILAKKGDLAVRRAKEKHAFLTIFAPGRLHAPSILRRDYTRRARIGQALAESSPAKFKLTYYSEATAQPNSRCRGRAMAESGHSRRIDTLATLAACPLSLRSRPKFGVAGNRR